jgi:hypothetical protein
MVVFGSIAFFLVYGCQSLTIYLLTIYYHSSVSKYNFPRNMQLMSKAMLVSNKSHLVVCVYVYICVYVNACINRRNI